SARPGSTRSRPPRCSCCAAGRPSRSSSRSASSRPTPRSSTPAPGGTPPQAVRLLPPRPPQPFFLSIGFFETHREFFEPSSVRDALYGQPPSHLPDTPETRADMASFKASARSLDQGGGAVLHGLDELGLVDDTVLVLTTDHGLPFPGAKATLTDRGLGVMLIVRGPHGFLGGHVTDALVSHVDLYPTLL